MLSEKQVEKLVGRLPFLAGRELRPGSAEPALAGADERALLESLVRFLSGLFLAQALRRGSGDERVVQFLDDELASPSLERWIDFQKMLLEERRVPFEEVFSLDFKRRDLLTLLGKRYLDFLEVVRHRLAAGGAAPAEPASAADFVDFLATYFKSDLVVADLPGGLKLVNKDRDDSLALYPVFRGPAEAPEVLVALPAGGATYVVLPTLELKLERDPALLERLAELFLAAGAYGQALQSYGKLDGHGGRRAAELPGARYAAASAAGLGHYRRGRYPQAVSEFEAARNLRPDLHQAHFNLALSLARMGNFSRANDLLNRLVEENPSVDRAHELLGDLHQMRGDPAAARRHYDKAFLANPYNRSVERKRRRLEERLEPPAGSAATAAPAGDGRKAVAAAAAPAESGESARVHELLIDLTQEAELGRYRPIVGREAELGKIIEILCCQSRSNPILIGEPGVGKTAIIEELANRLVRGQVPRPLRGKRLYLMSVATLLAGAKFRGQFEERVLQLIERLKGERCLLFIDDIHTIVNSGLSKGGTLDTSSLLKPALVRGELQAIGATTYDEFRLNFEKDPSLVRSFQVVEIEEPASEAMKDILNAHTTRLGEHHGVVFEPMDQDEITRLTRICLRDRRLPDIAINVLDRAAARVGLREEARVDAAEAVAIGDAPLPPPDTPVVRREDVIEVIAEMSGVPVQRLSQGQADRFMRMEAILGERVIGQEDALKAVAQVMRTVKLNLDLQAHRPDGVFLFVGPSGVGKTELARALAEFLFGDQDKMIRIDMSEYMERISSSRLIGTAPGYVGYNDQNQLTDQVRKSPYSVVLLDEIEKADSQMLNLFLQVFDAGRLTDGKGRTVHFSNSTIIMTSNVGTHLFSQARAGYGGGRKGMSVGRSELMKEVKRFFPPEFLNRIDEVVFFRQLDEVDLRRIAGLQLRDLTARLAKQGIELEVTEAVYALLVQEGASPEFGARNLSRTIRRRILDPLALLALHSPWDQVSRVQVTARDRAIEVALTTHGGRALEPAELTAGEADLEADLGADD